MLYGQKGQKMPENTKKTCVFSEGGISDDQNTIFLYFLKLHCIAEPMQVTKSPYLS